MDKKLLYGWVLAAVALCVQVGAFLVFRKTGISDTFGWGLQALAIMAAAGALGLGIAARE